MRRWLREPLVHFLVLGALLFGAYGWLHRHDPGSWDTGVGPVRITAKEVAFLAQNWVAQQQRAPTADELHALIAGYLKEELLNREAREMALDQNDLIIRRRLAQKVEFVVDNSSRLAPPTEDDLRRYYQANLVSYQTRAQVSFVQIFFNTQSRPNAVVDAKAAFARLSRGGASVLRGIGDPFPLDAEVRAEVSQVVAGQFGDAFAKAVFALKPGAWQGPIASSFGEHLVLVTEAQPARQIPFAEAEPQVREDLRAEQQRAGSQQYYGSLLKKYHVIVDDSVKSIVGPLDGFATLASATVAVTPK